METGDPTHRVIHRGLELQDCEQMCALLFVFIPGRFICNMAWFEHTQVETILHLCGKESFICLLLSNYVKPRLMHSSSFFPTLIIGRKHR